MKFYHEDPSALHIGTLPMRCYYIPSDSPEPRFGKNRLDGSRTTVLNGQWDFALYESPSAALESSLEVSSKITVPGMWNLQGYEEIKYLNLHYPFPVDPPYVPVINPTGVYSRDFDYTPGEFDSHLVVEGACSCFYLLVNGQHIGYSQVSHAASEFDLTPHLAAGRNNITLMVLKHCDGTYLEDQDMFRMSGIFRDIYILRRPKKRLWSYNARVSFTPDYEKAALRLELESCGEVSVFCELVGPDGNTAASGDAALPMTIAKPVLWNAEQPRLYTLRLRISADGQPDEYITDRLALRDIAVKDEVVLLNGKPFRIKGVNRHDADPVVGYAVDYSHMETDLLLMKSHNINSIRTSHYPPPPQLLELCDEMGFYVIDEADLECHGCFYRYPEEFQADEGYFLNLPSYRNAVMDRVELLVRRDINRGCVLFWSLGNEAGWGRSIEAAAIWALKFDDSRLLHYEGFHVDQNDAYFSLMPVESSMYRSEADIEKIYSEQKFPKPFMLCEYVHSTSGIPGDPDYYECMERHPNFLGGLVWQWADHAVTDADGHCRSGSVFGDTSYDNPSPNGFVFPDRRPHSALLDYKNTVRPLQASLEGGMLAVRNTLDFADANELFVLKYVFEENGKLLSGGEIPLPSIPPRETALLPLPSLPSARGEAYLTVSTLDKNGSDVGFDQFKMPSEPLAACPFMPVITGKKALRVDEERKCITISGENGGGVFEYVIDKSTGLLSRMNVNGLELLTRPMDYNLWRAPDPRDAWVKKWSNARYDRVSPRVYGTKCLPDSDGISLESSISLGANSLEPCIRGTAAVRIGNDGAVTIKLSGKMHKAFPPPPRFGVRLFLDKSLENAEYFGCGPYENYIDKRQGARVGMFESDLDGLFEDYTRPQENGSRYGVSYLKLSGGKSSLYASARPDAKFCFSASQYTREELENTKLNWELTPCGDTVLCLDSAVAATGFGSRGSQFMERHVKNGLSLEITLMTVDN